MHRQVFAHKSKLSQSCASNSTECCEAIRTAYKDDELLQSPAKPTVKKRAGGLFSLFRFNKKSHSKHPKEEKSSVQPLSEGHITADTRTTTTTTSSAAVVDKKSTRDNDHTNHRGSSSVLSSFRIMRRMRKSTKTSSDRNRADKSVATKRQTPEGANLSISEISLINIESRDEEDMDEVGVDDGSKSDGKTSSFHNKPPINTAPTTSQRAADRFSVHETQSDSAGCGGEASAEPRKSENEPHNETLDTSTTTTTMPSPSCGRVDRSPIEVDVEPTTPDLRTSHSSLPHNVSEVAITKVSVASLSSEPSAESTCASHSKGAIKKTITTTSHHQTRREIFEIPPPSMSNKPPVVDGCIDRANLNRRRVVGGGGGDNQQKKSLVNELLVADDELSAKRENEDEEHCGGLSGSESLEKLPKIHVQFDTKEEIMSASTSEKREHLYKILVIGELGTGKTSFIKRYVHQFFSQNYRATIGVDFALKVLNWDQNTIIRLQLWDIAGQERFGNMTRVYYKEAVGAFIVFDITRSATFDAVVKWKQDLDSKVQLPNGSPIPCILLANKCDQPKNGMVSNAQKMDEYVKQNGFAGWFETSAKENINIEEAARALVNNILLNDKMINTEDIVDADKFGLAAPDSRPKKNNCSC